MNITKLSKLKENLIDFCKLSGSHSEENLFESFIECYNSIKILTKVYLYYFLFFYVSLLLFIYLQIYENIDCSMYYR